MICLILPHNNKIHLNFLIYYYRIVLAIADVYYNIYYTMKDSKYFICWFSQSFQQQETILLPIFFRCGKLGKKLKHFSEASE